MKATVLLAQLLLASASCRGIRSAPAAADIVGSRADTADILQAVWRASSPEFHGLGVMWFYLPDADSAGFATSHMVRTVLAERGVPASARLPAGHDTVVFRVRRWTSDSTGSAVIELSSGWTHIRTGAPNVCLLGGTSETYRVHRTQAGWAAGAVGPGLHGDGYCAPSRRRP